MPEAVPAGKLSDFLRTVPPFHLLSSPDLETLARTLVIEYFPKGETILNPEGPATQFLYIIRSGGVRILVPEKKGKGAEKVFDYRDEGDFFGLISLLSGEPSPFIVVAEEDTLCYLIKKDVFKKILEEPSRYLTLFYVRPKQGVQTVRFKNGFSRSSESDRIGCGTGSLHGTGEGCDAYESLDLPAGGKGGRGGATDDGKGCGSVIVLMISVFPLGS